MDGDPVIRDEADAVLWIACRAPLFDSRDPLAFDPVRAPPGVGAAAHWPSLTRRPGRILRPRRGQGGNRADGCEACAERPTREGVLRTEEGGSRQPDPSEVPAPAAGDAVTVKHGAGRAAAAV